MNFFSIDIETTGLDENENQILSIAIVADGHIYTAMEVVDLPCLHFLVKHNRIVGHPKALAMNANLIRRMCEDGCVLHDLETAELLCLDFLARFGVNTSSKPDERQRYVAAGKNFASFDRRFLKRYMPRLETKFHHRSLDPSAYFICEGDTVPPSTEDCLSRCGYPDYGVKHDALEDARNVCRLLRHQQSYHAIYDSRSV